VSCDTSSEQILQMLADAFDPEGEGWELEVRDGGGRRNVPPDDPV
jgi:hypothetical protein